MNILIQGGGQTQGNVWIYFILFLNRMKERKELYLETTIN
jgi:hypothetical protein